MVGDFISQTFTLKRIIAVVVPIIVVVIGSVYFLEDRYTKKAEAQEIYFKACQQDALIRAELGTDILKVENLLVSQLEQFTMRQDQRYLDELYRRKMLYERFIRESPNDQVIVDEYNAIQEDIKRLRGDIDEMRYKINTSHP